MPIKSPFDIAQAIYHLREAVKPFRKAAMFELADDGFGSPFEQLIACIISIRTYDEVSLPCANRLFALARTPETMSQLTPEQIAQAIHGCTFAPDKAIQIQAIAKRVAQDYGGVLPCDDEVMRSFKGVGPKCANLALGIGCGQARISVDIHVHRVTNRWGYVRATTPEKTLAALEAVLPKQYWVEINRLLVPFGKHICTGQRPKCQTCPLLSMCGQVGVLEPSKK
jgi:endonuclease III